MTHIFNILKVDKNIDKQKKLRRLLYNIVN